MPWSYIIRINFTTNSQRVTPSWKHWPQTFWKTSNMKLSHPKKRKITTRQSKPRRSFQETRRKERKEIAGSGHPKDPQSTPNPRRPSLKPEVSNKTGGRASPSGRADRPPCHSYKKGSCLKDKNIDYWHPPFCAFSTSETHEGRSATFRVQGSVFFFFLDLKCCTISRNISKKKKKQFC